MLWRVVDRVSLVSVTIGLIVFTASASASASASATGVGFGRTADVTAPKAVALQPERMLATETMVRRRFPDVLHLSSEGLAQRLSGKSGVLLLDVREADEFAVGHPPNSIRVDPNIPTDAFLQRYSSSVRGKMVVFYCSVGMRSSALAQRVQRELFAAGADRVYNLNGGIFHWHNEERGLVDGRGAMSLVHKYDDTWGQLVRRSALAVSRPAPKN